MAFVIIWRKLIKQFIDFDWIFYCAILHNPKDFDRIENKIDAKKSKCFSFLSVQFSCSCAAFIDRICAKENAQKRKEASTKHNRFYYVFSALWIYIFSSTSIPILRHSLWFLLSFHCVSHQNTKKKEENTFEKKSIRRISLIKWFDQSKTNEKWKQAKRQTDKSVKLNQRL